MKCVDKIKNNESVNTFSSHNIKKLTYFLVSIHK